MKNGVPNYSADEYREKENDYCVLYHPVQRKESGLDQADPRRSYDVDSRTSCIWNKRRVCAHICHRITVCIRGARYLRQSVAEYCEAENLLAKTANGLRCAVLLPFCMNEIVLSEQRTDH